MKYGYIENVYDNGYKLISPLILNKISLNICGHSTFLMVGKQYMIIKRLKVLQELKIEMNDPTQNEDVNICLELRRDYNLFFSNCEIVLRPCLRTDLNNNNDSHPVLNQSLKYPLVKKFILPKISTVKMVLNLIFGNYMPLNITPIPVNIYQVGRLRLNHHAWLELNLQRRNIQQEDINRIPSYSNSEFEYCLPPSYNDTLLEPHLPRYSTNNSLNRNNPPVQS